MNRTLRRAGVGLLTGGLAALAIALSAGAANAMPPGGFPPPPPDCPPGYHEVGDGCVRNVPPPPPDHAPVAFLDLARETTDLANVHIVGWAADSDAPTTPLTVSISVDGAVTNVVANVNRPDVAAAFPAFGPLHGYDVTLPVSNAAHTVCVTALDANGSNNTSAGCVAMDQVVSFTPSTIAYDTADMTIISSGLDQLDKVSHTNRTKVEQTTTVSGSRSVEDVAGWSDTEGVKVDVSAGFSIGIVDLKGDVEGSVEFTQNGSQTITRTYTWTQPLVVPAKSRVTATIAVTQARLAVPYTLSGTMVYQSGATAPGTSTGVYTGVSSDDLQIELRQTNLAGKPAATPAAQPAPTLHVTTA